MPAVLSTVFYSCFSMAVLAMTTQCKGPRLASRYLKETFYGIQEGKKVRRSSSLQTEWYSQKWLENRYDVEHTIPVCVVL
ncbi:uncharacterized protein CLUP02_06173 [Colletotrichum lupini]|uniref:Secreted protein n=1 Tax=Colletotrichum lupini TaxID=145971 RepID=A0A9Q8SNK9_9PEZI|nr:uncharacterized protein CLUP02_06173 [Colletotrichum lupini]KAK1714732.1 hypothetical protein BDP67DRAFT_26438 [Colletotrichum lupini]UQC80689.1 hypothetical protein CLUP02_06173 [Colletotrichum lupini]